MVYEKESTLRLQKMFCSIVIPWSELMNFIDHIVIPSKTNVVAKKPGIMMGKVAGICKKNVKSGRHKRALARACHWTLDRQWFVMTPGVFTSFFRSVSRAFFRVKIAAVQRMAQKVKKKSCENLVRCWSTEDEIVTLIKVNDYGYEGGFSLLCSGANDHIFSRQKVVWNESLSWFLCFNSYLCPIW